MSNLLPGMTGQQIVDAMSTMTDDDIDPVQALFYVNAAKDMVEAGRDWYFNRSFDNSQTWNPGDTYLTMHPLPADFLAPRELYLLGDILPYGQITFDKRERFKDIYRRYYIDYKNKQYALCGSGPGVRTIDFYYGCATDQITLETYPVWPTQFHSMLPFLAASMWSQAQDGDDINWKLGAQQERFANIIMKMMIAWDGRIRTKDYNDRNSQNFDLRDQPNVVGTEFLFW